MFIQYWFSGTVGKWLLADKSTGDLIAQFDHEAEITQHFMAEVVEHTQHQCECPRCDSYVGGEVNEVDILEIKTLLGHASITPTQIYTHTNTTKLRSAVDRLESVGADLPNAQATAPMPALAGSGAAEI